MAVAGRVFEPRGARTHGDRVATQLPLAQLVADVEEEAHGVVLIDGVVVGAEDEIFGAGFLRLLQLDANAVEVEGETTQLHRIDDCAAVLRRPKQQPVLAAASILGVGVGDHGLALGRTTLHLLRAIDHEHARWPPHAVWHVRLALDPRVGPVQIQKESHGDGGVDRIERVKACEANLGIHDHWAAKEVGGWRCKRRVLDSRDYACPLDRACDGEGRSCQNEIRTREQHLQCQGCWIKARARAC